MVRIMRTLSLFSTAVVLSSMLAEEFILNFENVSYVFILGFTQFSLFMYWDNLYEKNNEER